MTRRRPNPHGPRRVSDRRRSRRVPLPTQRDTGEAISLLEGSDWGPDEVAELQEFLTCERSTRRADPDFRERLRLDLWWALLVRRSGGSERLPRA